ncbi:MAG: hypothetical protein QOG62_1516 [Thermoleophilaceae bacterium]|jgi:EAL domain-containing protein (putative c-di-GMP-specific phosphodiesterase class I)|nr:hypothetical protein [Thermoleophilaceae bacterium]
MSSGNRIAREPIALPLLALVLLLGVSGARFVAPEAHDVLLFALIPIGLFAVMYGWRGGLLSATWTVGVYLVWAFGRHDLQPLEYLAQPLAFFMVGSIAGFYAHGALGDYDLQRQALRRELQHAIEAGHLVLHYQPIVGIEHGAIIALEALVRWQHPKRGMIGPNDFIPAAERDPATIQALTLHTLELAARFARDRLDRHPIRVAVNLSPAALADPRLPEKIGEALAAGGGGGDRIEVEITETAFVIGEEAVAEMIEQIRALGIGSIVLDDFGVGHSSLARLRALKLDGLKIDRALAGDLERRESEVIVKAIMEMAHGLGMPVTAEGVEDEKTRSRLRELGCDNIQGYGVSPPLPEDEIIAWLDRPGS